jgi:hypothetical protein
MIISVSLVVSEQLTTDYILDVGRRENLTPEGTSDFCLRHATEGSETVDVVDVAFDDHQDALLDDVLGARHLVPGGKRRAGSQDDEDFSIPKFSGQTLEVLGGEAARTELLTRLIKPATVVSYGTLATRLAFLQAE